MKLCGACKGTGFLLSEVCTDCDGEGVDVEVTFTKKKIVRQKTMKYQEHHAKVQKERSKINKKGIRDEI